MIIQQVRDHSITVEHIVLLNSYLEEDLQTLKDLNIPPEEYQYGYYRKDSGEIYTYDVDPGTPVTIYDISQEYGAGEDRLYTFETWQEFVSAVQANERLLIQPYTLTIQDGVVNKIVEETSGNTDENGIVPEDERAIIESITVAPATDYFNYAE